MDLVLLPELTETYSAVSNSNLNPNPNSKPNPKLTLTHNTVFGKTK